MKNNLASTPDFKAFVAQRWRFSLIMAGIMLFAYFGFILIVAFNKSIFAISVSKGLSLGIVAGLGLIILAWAMTGIYVNWANTVYDSKVENLKSKL